MLAKNEGDRHNKKHKQIVEKLEAGMQRDTQVPEYVPKTVPYKSTEKTAKGTRKRVLARAYSFSMEPPLYEHFRTLCIERGVNSSACIRNLIMLQMKAWRNGDHDETLGED